MLKVNWPPVRDIFIPDPGWVFFDMDLEGADAQVVAWEANDDDLKSAFKRRVKIHAHNALKIYGPEIAGEDGRREPIYTRVKRGVHLTNYGGQTATLARKCAMSIREAERFQYDWFCLHPGIVEWHERTMFELQTTGITSNRFGYSIPWFDRPSTNLWRKALAWKPQSTIAHVTEEAMIRLHKEKQVNKYFNHYMRLSMNVHDSLMLMVKREYIPAVMPRVHELLHTITIPYEDPLIIPWGVKRGAISWGKCKTTSWDDILNDAARNEGAVYGEDIPSQIEGLDNSVHRLH